MDMLPSIMQFITACMMLVTSCTDESKRIPKAPARYAPNDFWRREIPAEAKRMQVQVARQEEAQLQRKREEEARLAEAHAEGLAEGQQRCDFIVKDIQARMEKMAMEQMKLKSDCRAAIAKAKALERKAEGGKRQKTLHSFFNNTPAINNVRPRTVPEELGQGYTERNITSKTFAHHVTAIEDHIIELSRGDPLKQLQLAAAVNQRMEGIRHLREKDQEAWGYVRNSLKAFFETLQDRYNGRYPNEVRAAQQAVCAAIANAAPPRKLHAISEAVGVSVDRLSEGRKHWSQWVGGDRDSIMDLRGKIRSDGMPEAWVELAVDVWKASTRRSERTKDSVRNPHDKYASIIYLAQWAHEAVHHVM